MADHERIPRMYKRTLGNLLLASLLIVGSTPGFSRDKNETIQATATGTSTQLGQIVGITVTIYEYSTMEDRQVLIEAFTKGQNQGLVNALTKMKAVGHIAITGTLGYDLSYIRMIPTPTGRKIRFATNRVLRFGEVYYNTQSTAFNLTAGEFDLNDTDKSKSSGVLYQPPSSSSIRRGSCKLSCVRTPGTLLKLSIGASALSRLTLIDGNSNEVPYENSAQLCDLVCLAFITAIPAGQLPDGQGTTGRWQEVCLLGNEP